MGHDDYDDDNACLPLLFDYPIISALGGEINSDGIPIPICIQIGLGSLAHWRLMFVPTYPPINGWLVVESTILSILL